MRKKKPTAFTSNMADRFASFDAQGVEPINALSPP